MACVIIFQVGHEPLRLDMDADEVGKRLAAAVGFERFEDRRGRPLWVNPANVLWVESRDKPSD